MKRFILFAPLIIFAAFLVVVAAGLYAPTGRTVPSQLVGRSVPEFALPPALPGRPGLASAELRGEPRLVNLFASWCLPCRIEAPQLAALERAGVRIDGIAIRDRPQDLTRFLAEHGDPFAAIGADNDRRVQLALGSAGVPETFVVDGAGVIRHQHIGVINPQDVPTILAALEAAR